MVTRYRLKLYLLALLILGGFGTLVARLYDIQIDKSQEYIDQLPGRRQVSVRIPGVRGEIKDRNGVPLVENYATYEVNFDLKAIVDDYAQHHEELPTRTFSFYNADGLRRTRPETDITQIVMEAVMPGLARLDLHEDFKAEAMQRHYRSTQGLVPYTYRRNISFKEFAMFAEHNLDLPGVSVAAKASRRFPYDSLACHLLGYVALPDIQKVPEEKRNEFDHYVGDDYGVQGIENTLDHYLQGRPGRRVVIKDEKGKVVDDEDAVYEEPKPGAEVYLTIDARIQAIVEQSLRKVGRGAAVVMDPQTGEILAMASVPSYNPNSFVPTVDPAVWKRLLEDPSAAMLNRAVNPYSPGSTFKVPIALAGGLGETFNKRFTCSGGVQYGSHYMKCWCSTKGYTHGSIDVSSAIKVSCNAFFYQYANDIGIRKIHTMTGLLGVGRKTGIPISGEKDGSVPGPEWLRLQGLVWTDAYTAFVSIGQGATEASPLQMASITATVCNGGKVYEPLLVHKVVDSDGNVIEDGKPRLRHDLTKEGLTAEQVEKVKRGMWRVVNEGGGTAGRAASEVTTLSGKTGTAQASNESGGTNAWFIAFAPYNDPELAVCVFVHNGESGGRAAAPIAKNIIDETMAMRKGKEILVGKIPEAVGHFDEISMVSFDETDLREYASDDADAPADIGDSMPQQMQARSSSAKPAVAAPTIREEADAEGSVRSGQDRSRFLRKLGNLFKRRDE